jgi:4-alpha-glucanotransferase
MRFGEPYQIEAEDGTVFDTSNDLPRELPPGYHTLRRLDDGAGTRLILVPPSCHLPDELRGWAWAVQLYAARSAASWGIGDLADLRLLAGWARDQGARALLLNPLHAPLPLRPQEPSPYFPSSRLYRNPLYLRVEEVPGAETLGSGLHRLAAAARDLNRDRLIDRDRVFTLKLQALGSIFDGFTADPEFDAYRRAEGPALGDYATFCTLSEHAGSPWTSWPAELRRPDSQAVRRFRSEHERRVLFHQWLQWLLDRQLSAAAGQLPAMHDLAVGVDPAGADAWLWQECLARDASVGAPPDPFAPDGQDWAVLAFDPWKLRRAGYEPFARMLRSGFRHGMGLRVDHVMGLFRLFWIPSRLGAAAGGYVRYPAMDLLGILALESRRAGAVVVGEDLGTVERGVREELARRRILSYRLLWFEDHPPAAYPVDALAALSTHDLPTLAGIWLGLDPDPAIRARLLRYGGVSEGSSLREVAEASYGALAAGPARLVAAQLEDALGVPERPNRPGTRKPSNWSLALPLPLEELVGDQRLARLARVLRRS